VTGFADFSVNRTADGWTIALGEYELRAIGVLRPDGTVRATVAVMIAGALKYRDSVTVSLARDRATFIEALKVHGVDLHEAVLLALDEAIRQSTPRAGAGDGKPPPDKGSSFAETGYSLAQLLDELCSFVREYVVLSDDQLTAVALWIVHTWIVAGFEVTPLLTITLRSLGAARRGF
jgi:hypothetical protein